MISRIAVGSIVVVTLLLIFTIVSTIGYNNWYGSFLNENKVDFKEDRDINSMLKELDINFLQINSDVNQNIALLSITKNTGELKCKFEDGLSLTDSGINFINITTCNLIQNETYGVQLITDNDNVYKSFFLS